MNGFHLWIELVVDGLSEYIVGIGVFQVLNRALVDIVPVLERERESHTIVHNIRATLEFLMYCLDVYHEAVPLIAALESLQRPWSRHLTRMSRRRSNKTLAGHGKMPCAR